MANFLRINHSHYIYNGLCFSGEPCLFGGGAGLTLAAQPWPQGGIAPAQRAGALLAVTHSSPTTSEYQCDPGRTSGHFSSGPRRAPASKAGPPRGVQIYSSNKRAERWPAVPLGWGGTPSQHSSHWPQAATQHLNWEELSFPFHFTKVNSHVISLQHWQCCSL